MFKTVHVSNVAGNPNNGFKLNMRSIYVYRVPLPIGIFQEL